MSDTLPALRDVPGGVEEAGALLADLDRCFELGFGRLREESTETLESLAASFTGTPLAGRLDDAVDTLADAEFDPDAFEAVAAARTSLQGARYDALLDHVCTVSGWSRPSVDQPDPVEPSEEVRPLLRTTQQWLAEVAIAGFGTLEAETVEPFESTLKGLREYEETERLSTLLSGFLRELKRNTPTASMESVPTARWTDVWARAMVHATRLPGRADGQPVSGELEVLGADLQHHERAVSVVVYGIFDGDDTDGERFVRTTVSAGKVEAIAGSRLWRMFPDSVTPLLRGVADNEVVDVEEATLQATGDLVWGAGETTGRECDKLALAEEYFAHPGTVDLTLPTHRPFDRHPARIAVPTYLGGYEVDEDTDGLPTIVADGEDGVPAEPLPLDVERISPYSGMDVEHVLGSSRMGGLLRFDGGGWTVQPLVETKQSKRVYTGMDTDPGKDSDLVETLHDRADALLREKS